MVEEFSSARWNLMHAHGIWYSSVKDTAEPYTCRCNVSRFQGIPFSSKILHVQVWDHKRVNRSAATIGLIAIAHTLTRYTYIQQSASEESRIT